MKLLKYLIIAAIAIVAPVQASALLGVDYTTKYDNNFDAVVTVTTPVNDTKKTITAIEFEICTKASWANKYDRASQTTEVRKVTTNLLPRTKKTFSFSIKLKQDYKVYLVYITRIRFADGTICDYYK